LGEQAEDAVLGRGPEADEVEPALQPLTQRALLQRRDPERRHELAPAELGEHAGVDLVGLASERGDALDLARVCHLDLPARLGEPVANPDRPAHHLQASAHLGPHPITSRASPSSSAGTNPSPKIVPSACFAHHAARRYAQSIPTYCIRAS
jgi:hypothetical protein